MDSNQDRRQYDILLDKVIAITENNLKAQSDYLKELTVIKNKFDINDRDHTDIKTQITSVSNNTYSILNKMNQFSNQEIIEILEKMEECNTKFSFILNNNDEMMKLLFKSFQDFSADIKNVKNSVLDTAKSFSMIQKLLGIILTAVIGIQIASVAWKSIQDHSIKNNIKEYIREELQK
jgi:hypothetical protein